MVSLSEKRGVRWHGDMITPWDENILHKHVAYEINEDLYRVEPEGHCFGGGKPYSLRIWCWVEIEIVKVDCRRNEGHRIHEVLFGEGSYKFAKKGRRKSYRGVLAVARKWEVTLKLSIPIVVAKNAIRHLV
jgi:hypothetical protein